MVSRFFADHSTQSTYSLVKRELEHSGGFFRCFWTVWSVNFVSFQPCFGAYDERCRNRDMHWKLLSTLLFTCFTIDSIFLSNTSIPLSSLLIFFFKLRKNLKEFLIFSTV